jgi:transcriptional regulator with XRE-family HTH domain
MKVLKMKRLLRDWSQAELARQSGLNQNTVCQIEAGRLEPYPSQLAKLARALGVDEDPEALLSNVDAPQS